MARRLNGKHELWVASHPSIDVRVKDSAAAFAEAFSKKFKRLFTQPDSAADNAWLQNHLEYQFAVAGEFRQMSLRLFYSRSNISRPSGLVFIRHRQR